MSQVVFVDEFTGAKGARPNPKKWATYPGAPTGATPTPEAVRLDGLGNLELVVTKPSESAAIWTKELFHLRPPFRATAWVQFPASWQIWHSFWWTAHEWERKGEIDFYENGGIREYYQSCVHEWTNGAHSSSNIQKVPTRFDPTKDFHRYGALVERTRVSFYLDGVQVAWRTLDPAYFDKPGMFMLSCWPANQTIDPPKFPAVMKVKRVEIRV